MDGAGATGARRGSGLLAIVVLGLAVAAAALADATMLPGGWLDPHP